MPQEIPGLGAREIIALIVTIAAVIGFLMSAVKLTFTKQSDAVKAGYNPGDKGFHLNTKNLSIVTLCVSAALLAVMGTVAFADDHEQWVYLGPGYGDFKWNFLSAEGSKEFKSNDIVVAQNNVNVRANHFSNFTQTWLSSLSSPEPEVIAQIVTGECVKILEFESVGFNKVWMKIERSSCPAP